MANQFSKMKIRASLARVKEPGSHKGPVRLQLADVIIVQQKRASDKMSWSHYPPRRGDDLRTKDSNGMPVGATRYADNGRPHRFHYRINVYEKVLN